MPKTNAVLANYLYFVPEGTVISGTGGGTVSAAFKPLVNVVDGVDVNWPEMGTVLDITPKINIVKKDIIGPVLGRYGRKNVVTTSATTDFDATLAEIDETFFQLCLAGGTIGEGGVYAPGAGSGVIRGWLKCQQYNAGTEVHKFDVYVHGEVKPPKEGNNDVNPVFTFMVIYSALAVGTITLG